MPSLGLSAAAPTTTHKLERGRRREQWPGSERGRETNRKDRVIIIGRARTHTQSTTQCVITNNSKWGRSNICVSVSVLSPLYHSNTLTAMFLLYPCTTATEAGLQRLPPSGLEARDVPAIRSLEMQAQFITLTCHKNLKRSSKSPV